MNLFDFGDFSIFNKKQTINLFEAFSGIGTQHMALKRLGIKVNIVGISEIDKFALKSYNAIHGKSKNYGAIGEFDLPPNVDLMTWSFPCQDISLAGNQKGMIDGSRSNYGYVFLDSVKKLSYQNRPKVLLMENVKALISETFKDDFKEILERLIDMGYENHWDVLNASHFGIPQPRERVFVVSILGGGYYNFPSKRKLKTRLQDYLEYDVDEKYYLSDKQLASLSGANQTKKQRMQYDRSKVFKPIYNLDKLNRTITTKPDRPTSNFIVIPEATVKGFKKAYEGDGIYINRPHQKRGVVQKGMIPTLKTSVNDLGVVVKEKTINDKNKVYKLRVRKLTPLESWRLMGISDDDFNKAKNANISDSQLYKQAGNAIVVDVLVAIFKQMF